jgi:anti-sigma B factor antagonist
MAQLQIQQRMNGQVAILDLKGKLTLGADTASLRERVRNLLGAGFKQILVNLKGVRYIDSSGLGELVGASATARRDDATLKLLNLTERVHDLLHMTKLLTIFETFETEEEAVRSFASAATASSSRS